MAIKIDKTELAQRINALEGLDNETKAQLLELLHDRKKYGLVWEEHPEDVEERLREELPVLVEDKSKAIISEDKDAPNHILIEGDNLEALTALSYTHEGKIDVIYIDPPYNTGNKDFVYNDAFVDTEDQYRHSKWLSFMAKRLKIAKRLLSDKGVIFISIDDNEVAQLKMLCDDSALFGALNYLSTFHLQVRYADKSLTEEKPFKPLMEYVLAYAKDSSVFVPKRQKVDYGLDNFCWRIIELAEGEKFCVGKQEVVVYKPGMWKIEKIDGNLNGLKETWITGSIYTKMSYGTVFKSIVEPRITIDGLGCLYKVMGRGDDGLGYRYYTGPAKINATKGKMYSAMPLEKKEQFISGHNPQRELPILTVFDYAPDFGNIRHEGGIPFASGKKPVKMLKELINLCNNKNAIVLDFFAGSGSTGHAVMQINTEDGGQRKSILVTNNENHICENITLPRLNNVINGYQNTEGLHKNTLRYYRTGFVARESSATAKRELMYASADMLCIKNDIYTEQKQFGTLRLRKDVTRYFADGDKSMLIIYNPDAIETIVKEIKTLEVKTPIIIYIFSLNDYAMDADFEEVTNKVKLCALP
ncbi:MAG: site-specific DNA-methyltransferase, partial [Prevotellaceae bacterium]|nr:site-specific DNA-methyltransferase [Candidatus Faecinaster equi]